MINSLEQSKARYLIPVLSFLLVIAASGCAGPKIAADLLANVDKRDQPLVKNAVAIEVAINPAINNDERIDESVKESLALALANANLFGADPARPYRINARVTVASQAAMSFGSFEGKLEINYVLLDAGNNKIMDETIHTEADCALPISPCIFTDPKGIDGRALSIFQRTFFSLSRSCKPAWESSYVVSRVSVTFP